MATRSLTTWRSERSVAMPACGSEASFGRPSVVPAFPSLGLVVDGLNRRIDATYQGKQAHNPVGVTSS